MPHKSLFLVPFARRKCTPVVSDRRLSSPDLSSDEGTTFQDSDDGRPSETMDKTIKVQFSHASPSRSLDARVPPHDDTEQAVTDNSIGTSRTNRDRQYNKKP